MTSWAVSVSLWAQSENVERAVPWRALSAVQTRSKLRPNGVALRKAAHGLRGGFARDLGLEHALSFDRRDQLASFSRQFRNLFAQCDALT
jgi:hypothetical protein